MKKPFEIDLALKLISDAVRPWPKAAMFELAEEGFDSPFEQLAACMISIRTYDEVSLPTARRLFARDQSLEPLRLSELAACYNSVSFPCHDCRVRSEKSERISPMSISPFSRPSYTLPNFLRKGLCSLRATGELTWPAAVRASTRSNKTSARLPGLRNLLIFVLFTTYFYQQVPFLLRYFKL